MEIVKANERVVLTECERCLLEKAIDLLDDIFDSVEDSEICRLTDGAANNINDLLDDYCD